ncbi:MAG: TraB/GumN family protein [Bacteroidota bacterium]
MKKILIALTAFIATAGVNAQQLEKGLLWKITGKGLEMPSYLFGTMHATCDATLDANVLKAIDNTSQLYLELDMDSPTLTSDMMGGMAMKGGATISAMVTEEEFNKIDAFLKENVGISAKMVDTYKPFILSSMLLPKQLGCPMQSYEMELVKHSQMQEEEIYGLETVQEQLTVFDNIPYQDQVNDLLKTVNDNMANSRAELKKLMTIYQTKDLNEMLAFMKQDGNPLYSNYMDVLLNNRNQNWIPKIEKIAKEKPTLFGVGAAHLAGEQGLIMLLRKKGYTVEPVQ